MQCRRHRASSLNHLDHSERVVPMRAFEMYVRRCDNPSGALPGRAAGTIAGALRVLALTHTSAANGPPILNEPFVFVAAFAGAVRPKSGRPWRWRTLPKLVPGRKANRFTFVTLAHDLAVVVIVAHDALLSLYANLQGLLQNHSRDPPKNVLRHSVQKRLWLSSSGCCVCGCGAVAAVRGMTTGSRIPRRCNSLRRCISTWSRRSPSGFDASSM